jgi:hypothetical protein
LENPGVDPDSLGSLAGFSPGEMDRNRGERAMIHDRVRLQLEADSRLRVGDLLQSFTVAREELGLGKVVRPTGLLSVTVVGDEVEALLTAVFGLVRVGDRVRMAPSYDLRPGAEAASVDSNVTATILGFSVDRAMQGPGALAFLDVGEREGIVIGDEFRAFESRVEPSFGIESATLQVVLVHGDVSTARVIKMKKPILGTGDRLRLIKKMY